MYHKHTQKNFAVKIIYHDFHLNPASSKKIELKRNRKLRDSI